VGDGRRGALAALVIAVIAFACGGAGVAIRISSPSSGTAIQTAGDAFTATGVTVDKLAGATTSLEDGDTVVAMAGRSTLGWAEDVVGGRPGPTFSVGDTVPFMVLRAGATQALDVRLVPYPVATVLATAWGTMLFVFALLAIALAVFGQRPTVPAAGALLIASAGAVASTVPYLLGQDPLDIVTGTFPIAAVTTGFVYLPLWAGLLDFSLVFPRPLAAVARRPWLRAVPYVAVFGAYATGLAVTAMTSPTALAWFGSWGPLSLLPVVAAYAGIPILLAYRWRRGAVDDRPLLRGLIAVVGFTIAVDLVIWVVPEALGGRALLPWTISGLTGLPFVVLIALAIVRHRAFDIDVVIRRSVVYGGLTVAVIVTYGLVVAVLGALIHNLGPFATSLLATGAAAVIALPVRDGLQRLTSRYVYGDRDEPVRAMRRLGERLEWTVDPEAMPRVVVDTVADALRLPYVGLELGHDETARVVAEHGVARPDLIIRPLAYGNQPVGRLLVAPRGPADPLSASDIRLLDDLTRQIGVAAHAVTLTEDLRRSRDAVVVAREEERRRLRRDLHDGLGPTLAAIGMRAEAAEAVLHGSPDDAERQLADLRAEVASAMADVRRLVDGLRPPVIDELGLVGALRLAADRLGASGTPDVSVDADGDLPELPAAVEVAAFRIATEAMTNAARHAGAERCTVRLVGGTDLTVTIEDDGSGLSDERRAGVGLASMQERAAELGGDCRVERRAEGGTRVIARLPISLGTATSGP
jgi:two-component system, NarL family, sensor kinase